MDLAGLIGGVETVMSDIICTLHIDSRPMGILIFSAAKVYSINVLSYSFGIDILVPV